MTRLPRYRITRDGREVSRHTTPTDAGVAAKHLLGSLSRSARRAAELQLERMERNGEFYRASQPGDIAGFEIGRTL